MHRSLLLAVVCLITVIGIAWGQGQSGNLNGTVLDKTGAVVPGAFVSANNVATGVEYKTTSTSAGSYTLPYLPAGTYTIKVTAPGFKELPPRMSSSALRRLSPSTSISKSAS